MTSPYDDDMEFVRNYAERNDGYSLVQPVVDFINAHLAHTIDGMYEEWAVEANGNGLFPVNEENHPNGAYFTVCRDFAEAVRDRMTKLCPHIHYRLVRRLVSDPEVIDGE